MTNKEVARALDETASLIELTGGNAFRARAFSRAARTVRDLETPIEEHAEDGTLTDVDGIGDGLAADIQALLSRGSFDLRDDLLNAVPTGLLDVLRVKGLGTKKVRTLWQELDITSLDELEHAAQAGAVASLDGFGKKTQQNIIENVRLMRRYMKRRRLPEALSAASAVVERLHALPTVQRAEVSGEARRRLETVGQVALIVVTERPQDVRDELADLVENDAPRPVGDDLVLEGTVADGLPLHVRIVPAERFGTAQWLLTGSAEHCAAFEEAYGAPAAFAEEADLYASAGVQAIPPELREGHGELEAAADDALPTLITFGDLRGTLHNHSTYSDGTHALRAMAEAAQDMGLEYFGVCDHSQSLSIANGMPPKRVREQQEEIVQLNKTFAEDDRPFRIFSGIESDVLKDGSLDYEDDVLASFDFVVASVHTGFNMTETEATERVIRAVSNPYTTILGHATGRLLLVREGYPLNHSRVIEACAEHNVAIELNANPYRLDMDWRWIREATERGVLISINPDAHATDELANMRWGTEVARKGWLTPDKCLNAKSLDAFAAWLDARQPQQA